MTQEKPPLRGGYEQLLQYAFRALARRALTEHEIHEKLLVRAERISAPQSEVEKVIDRLKDLNYLNDEEFAERYISSRTGSGAKPKGRYVLSQELSRKGIPKELFEKVWSRLAVDEVTLAIELCKSREKRFANLKLKPYEKRQKLAMHLAGRGFSLDVINQALASYLR